MIEEEQEILRSPECSRWLKEQLQATQERDVLDALCDAEVLVSCLKRRFELLAGTHDNATQH